MNKKAFTLVELLVVITIIAILGVVAYTQFSGATDKAKTSTKISNINAISQALSMYKTEKGFYPKTADYNVNNNIWGYNSANAEKTCDTGLSSDADGKLTGSITTTKCGGNVFAKDGTTQIGAKGILAYSGAIKKYLKKDAYDNQVGDLEFGGKKLIDYGIGRFPYAIYAKGIIGNNKNGLAYNIAYTIKEQDGTEVTKIVGDFNDASCTNCPDTLIGPGGSSSDVLKDGDKNPNVPYKVSF